MAEKNTVVTELLIRTDGSKKSIAELQKTLRGLQNQYKNLSGGDANEGAAALRAQIEAVNAALQESGKELNSIFKRTSDNGKEAGNAIANAFRAERIAEFTEALGALKDEGASVQDGVNALSGALSKLGPYGAIAGQLVQGAFADLQKQLDVTEGGTTKLIAGFEAFKRAVVGVMSVVVSVIKASLAIVIVPLRGLYGLLTGKGLQGFKDAINDTGAAIKNIASTAKEAYDAVGEAYSRSLRKQARDREIATKKAQDVITQAAIEEQDKLQANNNKSFEEQKTALDKRLALEKQASADRARVAQLELENFTDTEEIKRKQAAFGANFVKELNAEQLETYLQLQNNILAEARTAAAKQAEYENDLTERMIEERDRRLAINTAYTNRILEKNQFLIDNRRLALDEQLKLETENFTKRKALLNQESAGLNKKFKADQLRAIELNNELQALEREHSEAILTIKREQRDRENDLQETKNEALISGYEKEVTLAKTSLEKQTILLQQIGDIQVAAQRSRLENLNKNDKDYLNQYEQILNEIAATQADTQDKITQNTLRNISLRLEAEAAALAHLQAIRANVNAENELAAKEFNNNVEQGIAEISDKINGQIGLIGKLGKATEDLKTLYKAQTDARIDGLNEVAAAETEAANAAIALSQKKIDALEMEVAASGELTAERKQQIEAEKQALLDSIAATKIQREGIKIDLKINTKAALDELKAKTKEATQIQKDQTTRRVQEVADLYANLNELTTAAIDYQLQKQLAANDELIKASQQRVEQNTKLLNEVQNREAKATGARKRRLDKEAKEIEARNQKEAENQKRLEAEKVEAEREASKKKQVLAIAEVAINTALAIAKLNASTSIDPTGVLKGVQIAIAVALGAAQIAAIASQKFAKGGIVFADGGMVHGNSHAQGGVKFAVGGRVAELEGGEAVINKRSMAIRGVREIASHLNTLGGGVAFAKGGMVFANGGILNAPQPASLVGNDMLQALYGIEQATRTRQVVLPLPTLREAQNKVEIARAGSRLF